MKIDWWLFIPAGLLSSLGLLIIRSVAPQLFITQLLFVAASFTAAVLLSSIDYRLPFAFHLPLYVISLILLILPFIFGSHTRGALRWLQFGSFTLQPSELVKPLLLIAFSMAVSSSSWKKVWPFVMFIIPWLIIFMQPDLGTSLVLGIGWIAIFLFRLPLKLVISSGLVFLLFLVPVYKYALRPYQRDRITTFINPFADPLGNGYHVIQSLIAVGSGQIWGKGLGHGTQSQLRFLPEHHTDFIFASLAEELGLVGSVFVLALFSVILWRLYHISQTSSSLSASLFCLASMSMLCFQIFINIGMNLGLAPVTGITLPFISYGGSSLLSLGILLGVASSISQNAVSRV